MQLNRLRVSGFAFALAAALLLGGCASDPSKLTRDRAAALIKPQIGSAEPFVRVTTGQSPTYALPVEDRVLAAVGLASLTTHTDRYGGQVSNVVLTTRGHELASAQKWSHQAPILGVTAWQIPVGSYQFDSVTGIQLTDKTHALVTFTYRSTPNDVGKQFLATGHADVIHVISPLAALAQIYPTTQTQRDANNVAALAQVMGVNTNPTMDVVFGKTASATVPFTLYDDGWRVGQ